jgi:hypothetical protein
MVNVRYSIGGCQVISIIVPQARSIGLRGRFFSYLKAFYGLLLSWEVQK